MAGDPLSRALKLGKGREMPPKSQQRKAHPTLRHREYDATATKTRDNLAGARRDILGHARGPTHLRKLLKPQTAGGASVQHKGL